MPDLWDRLVKVLITIFHHQFVLRGFLQIRLDRLFKYNVRRSILGTSKSFCVTVISADNSQIFVFLLRVVEERLFSLAQSADVEIPTKTKNTTSSRVVFTRSTLTANNHMCLKCRSQICGHG